MVKIAINGFGRIGRLTLRKILQDNLDVQVIALNDLGDAKTLAHLFKYDSSYGIFPEKVEAEDSEILIGGKRIKFFSEKDPLKLPWKELGIDIVIESTGVFRDYDGAEKHIKAGAKRVLISAPSKTPEKVPTFLFGINLSDMDLDSYKIIDMGSCTTNCLAPIVKILDQKFGIKKGFMTTVHSYTNDQRILDLPHKDIRRARTAGLNIIPTTTGAAKTIGKCLPNLQGKLNGIALRVPTATVSIVDLTVILKKETTAEEINSSFRKASKEEMKKILKVEDTPLVSSDYKGDSFSSIVDSSLTEVSGNLVKILAWYDNEWSYASRLAEMAEYIGKK